MEPVCFHHGPTTVYIPAVRIALSLLHAMREEHLGDIRWTTRLLTLPLSPFGCALACKGGVVVASRELSPSCVPSDGRGRPYKSGHRHGLISGRTFPRPREFSPWISSANGIVRWRRSFGSYFCSRVSLPEAFSWPATANASSSARGSCACLCLAPFSPPRLSLCLCLCSCPCLRPVCLASSRPLSSL